MFPLEPSGSRTRSITARRVRLFPMTTILSPQSLRKQLRDARRNLSGKERLQHEVTIAEALIRLPLIQRSQRVACYLSEDGEVDLGPLQWFLDKQNKKQCLPVLRHGAKNRLWFCHYSPGDRLLLNRFRIAEPDTRKNPPLSLRSIDVILMPLVGFDDHLNRLGMGGGFYDRTFSMLRRAGHWRRPRLIGIAHECQRVEALDRQPWDVPMDLVITESGIYTGNGERHPIP